MDRQRWLDEMTKQMVENLQDADHDENDAVHRPEPVMTPLDLGEPVKPPELNEDGTRKG